MAQNVMRRAGQAAVATGVASAVNTIGGENNTIHAEEINDVARVVFGSGSNTGNQCRSGMIRVSSDPVVNESLIDFGKRLASNPNIQVLVQEEFEGWLLVPGGPSVHSTKEGHSQSSPAIVDPVRTVLAAELSQLTENDFRIPRRQITLSRSVEEIDEDLPQEEILTPRGPPDVPQSASPADSRTLLEKVFDWIENKLSSVFGLFDSTLSSNQCPNEAPQCPDQPSAPSIQAAKYTAAALGIAAVLIVLVSCRRFSPALFKAATRFL